MICLTRLNGKEFILNCELIKLIEATPDTVITLTQGEKLMVMESVETILNLTVHYRQRLNKEPEAFLMAHLKERLPKSGPLSGLSGKPFFNNFEKNEEK